MTSPGASTQNLCGHCLDSVSGYGGLVLAMPSGPWTVEAPAVKWRLGAGSNGTAGTMVVDGAGFLNDAFAKDV